MFRSQKGVRGQKSWENGALRAWGPTFFMAKGHSRHRGLVRKWENNNKWYN